MIATAPKIKIDAIRKHFPLLERKMNGKPLVFLDSGASSQKPIAVIKAVEEYYTQVNSNVHRGVYQLSQEATNMYEAARKAVQGFLNAELEEEIIFVKGTTEGINLVAHSFSQQFLRPGDEILISGMEHHANIVPWQMACERFGARLRVIPVSDKGELVLDQIHQLLNDKTKLLAVVQVSNTLGTINPIKELVGLAHEKNIPVLVDGAQVVPHYRVDVQDLDADFYTFSGHKMYGPMGIGILYGKKSWLDQMPPYQGGGDMIDRVTFEKTTFNDLPHKFEAGTPNVAGAVGLHAAIAFLDRLDYAELNRHELQLLRLATEGLQKIPGLRIIGQAEQKSSVISFVLEGAHPYDLGVLLDKLGIAVRTGHHCTQPLMDQFQIPGTVRASFACYNTEEDIQALIAGVERAARMLR